MFFAIRPTDAIRDRSEFPSAVTFQRVTYKPCDSRTPETHLRMNIKKGAAEFITRRQTHAARRTSNPCAVTGCLASFILGTIGRRCSSSRLSRFHQWPVRLVCTGFYPSNEPDKGCVPHLLPPTSSATRDGGRLRPITLAGEIWGCCVSDLAGRGGGE